MKVALINFFYAYNYGAVLQCTALKEVLEKQGHEVDIIDYRPEYQMQYYLEFPNPFKSAKIAWKKYCNRNFGDRIELSVKWGMHIFKELKNHSQKSKLHILFEPYIRKNFNLTKRYCTYGELLKDSPQGYDAYICGSDQLWNPDVTWGVDPAYFLNFGEANIKRIAYAVSPCGLDLEVYGNDIAICASKLDYISLREKEKKGQLERLLNRTDIHICPDPTLLLRGSDYKKYEETSGLTYPYILFYGFKDREKDLLSFTEKISRDLSLPIIDASLDIFNWNECTNVERKMVTPGEFLSYIKNATLVVTNSFHGTAFSIIYHKNFMTIEKTGTASRMKELLCKLHLQDRIIDISNPVINMGEHIDYRLVDHYLEEYASVGYKYLMDVF